MVVPGLLGGKLAPLRALPVLAIIKDSAHLCAAYITAKAWQKMRESKIREELAEVLQGVLPLEDFAYWLRRHRNDIYQRGTPTAQTLAASIALVLYEYDDGYRTDDELRKVLSQLLGTYHILVDQSQYQQTLSEPIGRTSSTGGSRHYAFADSVATWFVDSLTTLNGTLVSI